jgi:cobalt-zinc-cadmium efflux system outer membrane protein
MQLKAAVARLLFAAILLAPAVGCNYETESVVQRRVCDLSSCPLDRTPLPAAEPNREATRPEPVKTPPPAPLGEPLSRRGVLPGDGGEIRPVAYSAEAPDAAAVAELPPKRAPGRPMPLEIPRAIPGSEAPPLRLPPLRPEETGAQRRSEIQKLFHDLGVPESVVSPQPAPGKSPLTLAELQSIAVTHSPLIRQAASDVAAARGAAIQAGAYPNPHVGYQSDDINTGRTGGYQGGAISQTIVTGGKLRLARQAAQVDVEDAEFALRRARFDLATQVRTNYLAVLVALERVKVNYGLFTFADKVYHIQVSRVTAGQAAPYEPLQLRVLAAQAQAQLLQSNHDYEAAWRRLAATLNCPEMRPAALAGRIDGPLPQISYEAARDRILQVHTDLAVAKNAAVKARYQLKLAKITPVVPNIDTNTVIEKDYTTPPFGTVLSLQVGVPVPIFDTNRGNIIAAEAALVRATSEYERARNDLLANLADVYARYATTSKTFEYYRHDILSDQVRAYRGQYERYQVDPDADFNDVVTSQQTLASTISTYIQLLGDRWQAVVDLAGLMQVGDLFQMDAAAK